MCWIENGQIIWIEIMRILATTPPQSYVSPPRNYKALLRETINHCQIGPLIPVGGGPCFEGWDRLGVHQTWMMIKPGNPKNMAVHT